MSSTLGFYGRLGRAGVAVLVLAVGFTAAACELGAGGKGAEIDAVIKDNNHAVGGYFVLTGIPAMYNGRFAFFEAFNEETGLALDGLVRRERGFDVAYQSFYERYILPEIAGGKVYIPMWHTYSGDEPMTRWYGQTTVNVLVQIFERGNIAGLWPPALAEVFFVSVRFENGSAARSFTGGDSLPWN